MSLRSNFLRLGGAMLLLGSSLAQATPVVANSSVDALLKLTTTTAAYSVGSGTGAQKNLAVNWDASKTYAFKYVFSASTGTSLFNVYSSVTLGDDGGFKSGWSLMGGSGDSNALKFANAGMKGQGYSQILLTVEDKQKNPALDVDLFGLSLNGKRIGDSFPGGVYPGITYQLFNGGHLADITLSGLFKVKAGSYDGTPLPVYPGSANDLAFFDIGLKGAGKLPEPTSLALIGIALLGAAGSRRSKKFKQVR
ncbi:PEP-CTERM sorting domain-containing protein [Paucibacter sp. APW11]|uniref:PEP-CTERM sorting domain-containing protein n=1 Tax=Roseateles aquae TaxID=3077235 RepID=A0ABU3PD54_9BURK|nr:PEP-CTERM sorting domain-containing protein [Paucibacter sp. APW11]MDT9000521.1 PEP-CTERM sorting domain-containing protein [Paucibacter sp. APW11]